jgi:hypothetical protein
MGRPLIIDVEDLADDISGIVSLLEKLVEMHEEETLRKLLKTERTSVSKETPFHANKGMKVFPPLFRKLQYMCEVGVSELAITETSMLVTASA